jgi:hypothetical protein
VILHRRGNPSFAPYSFPIMNLHIRGNPSSAPNSFPMMILHRRGDLPLLPIPSLYNDSS